MVTEEEQKQIIKKFIELTVTSDTIAEHYLAQNSWNLEVCC